MARVKVIGRAKQLKADTKLNISQPKTTLIEYKPTESQIAVALTDYMQSKYPKYIMSWIKIDNEGKLSWAAGKLKKAQGKRKGASDHFLAVPTVHQNAVKTGDNQTTTYVSYTGGLWLEEKTHKGKESKAQLEFANHVVDMGYAYQCVHSVDAGMQAIDDYLKNAIQDKGE